MEQLGEGGVIFIEVFLSKTLVNIEMAPSIHDTLLLLPWIPADLHRGASSFPHILLCLYTLTKHVASDDWKRYNSWKEIRATLPWVVVTNASIIPLFFLRRISCTYIYVYLCVCLHVQVGKDGVVLFTLPLTHLDWQREQRNHFPCLLLIQMGWHL